MSFSILLCRLQNHNLTLEPNKEPFTDPLADDAVLVGIQTDNDHKTTVRTDKTITIAVSEAGGTQVYIGAKTTPMFITALKNSQTGLRRSRRMRRIRRCSKLAAR